MRGELEVDKDGLEQVSATISQNLPPTRNNLPNCSTNCVSPTNQSFALIPRKIKRRNS